MVRFFGTIQGVFHSTNSTIFVFFRYWYSLDKHRKFEISYKFSIIFISFPVLHWHIFSRSEACCRGFCGESPAVLGPEDCAPGSWKVQAGCGCWSSRKPLENPGLAMWGTLQKTTHDWEWFFIHHMFMSPMVMTGGWLIVVLPTLDHFPWLFPLVFPPVFRMFSQGGAPVPLLN